MYNIQNVGKILYQCKKHMCRRVPWAWRDGCPLWPSGGPWLRPPPPWRRRESSQCYAANPWARPRPPAPLSPAVHKALYRKRKIRERFFTENSNQFNKLLLVFFDEWHLGSASDVFINILWVFYGLSLLPPGTGAPICWTPFHPLGRSIKLPPH